MVEKELCKGKFTKTNGPACICLAIAILLGGLCVSEMAYDDWYLSDVSTPMLISAIVCVIISVIFFVWMSGCSITVTNKRVYGIGAFRKRVDLPFDMISSVGSAPLNGIAVATASGKICFWFVVNRNDIFDTISNCLIERQNKSNNASVDGRENPKSNADELRKYKELLDDGIIAQEEFDAKKKQLLGL